MHTSTPMPCPQRMKRLVVAILVPWVVAAQATEFPTMLDVQERLLQLERRFHTQLDGWRVSAGDVSGAEVPDFDDSSWEEANIGYRWDVPNSIRWFRRWVTVPERVGGLPVAGERLALRMSIDNGGSIYVNGELRQASFDRADGYAVLSESARPGERMLVAVRAVNRPGWGTLLAADLESSAALKVLPATTAFVERLRFATGVVQTGHAREEWVSALTGALDAIRLDSLSRGDTAAYLASVDRAEAVLVDEGAGVLRNCAEARLEALQPRMTALADALRRGDSQGLDLSYQRAALTVAREFSLFAKDDLGSDNLRIVTRGVWNTDYIVNAVDRALAEARAILAEPALQRPVPRYETGPVEIRDGAFWQGSQPLFFVGMGHFDQVRKDIPIFPDYGYSIAQLTISVGSVLPAEDEVNEEPINRLIAVLDRAAEANVAVDVLIEPHGWPHWANETYPELVVPTRSFLKYKIDHPKARAILERYLSVLVPRIKDHPALFSYCLFNEPHYADTSEYSHRRFQEWLQARHGAIETLNERHKAAYAAFDAVPMPEGLVRSEGRGEKPALASEKAAAAQAPLMLDWYRFNQERFSEVHQWVVDTIRALDPETPVHSKVMGRLFDTYLEVSGGIDHEQWARATDISGNDNWSYYRSWTDHDKSITGKYAGNWWRQAMYYDFQRSVAPGHPVFNSENHPIEDDTPIWVAGRHIRTVYWQGAVHGQGATTTWVWQRGDSRTLGDCIITRANCAHALGQTGLDLLRFAKEIVALQQIEPEVALLVVPASIPFAEDYLNGMKRVFESLQFLGTPVGFVTERGAEEGRLDDFKAVFVPEAARMPDSLVEGLDAYVREGGTLVTLGSSFAGDEYGNPRPLPEFMPDGVGEKPWTSREHGRGRVVSVQGSTGPDTLQHLGDAMMSDLGVARPIRITDEKGGVITGVEYRSVPHKSGYLLNIVSYCRHEMPVRIIAPERIVRITNLIENAAAPDFFELEPLDPLLLYIETAS